jgi:hypothetical protein
MATAVDTVSVEREALLEAVSWLYDAGSLFDSLNDATGSELGRLFDEACSALRLASFGEPPEEDAEYESDPVIVEMSARGSEHAANVLKALGKSRELVKPLDENDLWIQGNRLETVAAAIRSAGNVLGEQ